ncbi:MAG: hypothetical protein HY897_09265 [Deltaproteobacteria bacterium]|nr:hypothetical protein [Deltaproteobacteria bacterium]
MERTGWRWRVSRPRRSAAAFRAAAAVFAAVAAFPACTRDRAVPAAKGQWLSYVFDKRNSCLLRRSGEIGWAEVIVGNRLFGGDGLKTGRDATARLRFRDGSSFDLLPESLIVLSESAGGQGPAAEQPIEIALLEGDLAGMVLDPSGARVGVTYGKGAARLAPVKGSSSLLVFRVSAKGTGGPAVSAGEAIVLESGAAGPRVIKAEIVAAPGPSDTVRWTEPQEEPRPRKPHAAVQQAEAPVLPKAQMDAIQERAANLEKISKKNMDALSRMERAAAARDGAAEKVLRTKLGDIRTSLSEVDRLLGAVLKQAEGIRDPSKRAAVIEELKSVEELQREISWEIRAVEGEIGKTLGK